MASLELVMFHFLINGKIILYASSEDRGHFILTGKREEVGVFDIRTLRINFFI